MKDALGLAAMTVLVVLALAACGGSAGAVTVDERTSPEDVVRSYLSALQEDDESGAVSLTTAAYSERDPWAEDSPTIEDVEVGEHMSDPSGPAATGYVRAVWVPVKFTLHGAETMPDGSTSWGYRVVSNTDADVWKVADAGW